MVVGDQGNQGDLGRLWRIEARKLSTEFPRDAVRALQNTWSSKMADPMRVRAIETAGSTEVKVLMKHDMETGLRKDPSGKPIPAHFIQFVNVRHGDKDVLNAQFGIAISKDPFLSFKFKGGTKGDKVVVTWTDNLGEKRSDEAVIA